MLEDNAKKYFAKSVRGESTMNAKSLVLNTTIGLFQSSRLARGSRRTALPRVRIRPLRINPNSNAANCGISEHEAIFLLQRRLLVK